LKSIIAIRRAVFFLVYFASDGPPSRRPSEAGAKPPEAWRWRGGRGRRG